MKKAVIFSMICCIAWMGFAVSALCEEKEREESLLTVPWDEFRDLLPLDRDEVVLPMATFKKLLVFSGVNIKPEHVINHGNVVLTNEEFKTLIDGLKPPVESPEEHLPFDYLITRAVYDGKVENDAVSFTGSFHFNLLKKDAPVNIPFLPQTIALDDIRLDGEQALVVIENGYHQVMVSKPGKHVASVSFSLKPNMEKGAHTMNLSIQKTPMTLLNMTLPSKDMAVTIPQAQKISSTETDRETRVSASITPGSALTVSWRKKDVAVKKIPAKVYSEIRHLVSIDDDALKINSEISYRIFHSDINAVTVQVPRDINVLNVTGEAVGEWRESVEGDRRVLLVPFTYGKKGTVSINVFSEKPLSGTGKANTFSGIRTLNTVHETGYIGMELKTSAEVNIVENTGLETIAAQKLPPSFYTKSERPLMYAFKYTKQPFSLSFDTKKHRKVSVPMAAINSANGVTLFTEDGKVVYHLLYHVKNSAKQFMKIALPEKADIWSVFVDDKPVQSSLNSQGELLVPLIRSRPENNALTTFPVEVIYCLTGEGLSFSGTLESHMPAVDILISRLMWSVYLPNDYAYHYFQSTLAKEEMIRGVNVFGSSQRHYDGKAMMDMYDSTVEKKAELGKDQLRQAYKGNEYGSHFKNLPLDEEQISSQMEAELNFSGRLNRLSRALPQASVAGVSPGAGVMPIQIAIPTGGQVYRFAKTIIRSDDPLDIRILYSGNRLTSLVRWGLWGLFAGCIFLMRRGLKNKMVTCYQTVKNHENTLRSIARSGMTPFILLGLALVCYVISGTLALVMFFLFWVSIVYRLVHGRKQKAVNTPRPLDSPESTTV